MLNQWQYELENLAKTYQKKRLSDFFLQDPQRVEKYSLEVGELYLDYSKNIIDETVLLALIDVAKKRGLSGAITRLVAGEKVNVTENRPALHTAWRQDAQDKLDVEGEDVLSGIAQARSKMSQIAHRLHSHNWRGATGKVIKHVVNLGIGGSDLGPKLVVQALKSYRQGELTIDFVANIDPVGMLEVMERVDPAATLFILASKSFTTAETLSNAAIAKQWLQDRLSVSDVRSHFVAVTSKPPLAQAWGVLEENILYFNEWVGGRYSVWSTIGLPVALSIGMAAFEDFLAGARTMDEHFKTAPFEKNMPVLLALIGVWYIHGWGATTQAILPYAHGLRRLADYLQQLDMESNGKSVQINGEAVPGLTGPIVWGQAGTNGQHAFYQLLHQGTHYVPMDFILCAQAGHAWVGAHRQLVANGLAQAQALMQGEAGVLPQENMPGNKPSNLLLLKKLTPFSLGELLALYEHKVFVQGVLWGINSFDQPGVELGKKLANKVLKILEGMEEDQAADPSTQALMRKIAQWG